MIPARRLKAQALSIEAVLVFGIGVTLFLSFFMVFGIYQAFFERTATGDQLQLIQDQIATAILKAIETDGDMQIRLTIPQKAANEQYRVTLDPAGLTITTLASGTSIFSDLYDIGADASIVLGPSEVISTSREITIYRTGNNIILL